MLSPELRDCSALPLLAQAIAPAWFVLPVAAVALFVVAGHWVLLAHAQMPATRKNIRTANGIVMLIAIPAIAYAFGVADTQEQRRFVLAWMLASGLLIIIIGLALADLLYTMSVSVADRKKLREEFRDSLAKRAKQGGAQASTRPGTQPDVTATSANAPSPPPGPASSAPSNSVDGPRQGPNHPA